ncbi:hypothetical protein GCM10010211_02130 [Streptomyces albospinus]|uniref:Secreted protein n=1 Tax=Streptomyces albospinus TaxID=285515 RepID=A0ABQ2UN36_9ACTN|nr:hypothetical protein GCM10010211_02130 [Streptomyces albospinus]
MLYIVTVPAMCPALLLLGLDRDQVPPTPHGRRGTEQKNAHRPRTIPGPAPAPALRPQRPRPVRPAAGAVDNFPGRPAGPGSMAG